jgi:hypothetical protein
MQFWAKISAELLSFSFKAFVLKQLSLEGLNKMEPVAYPDRQIHPFMTTISQFVALPSATAVSQNLNGPFSGPLPSSFIIQGHPLLPPSSSIYGFYATAHLHMEFALKLPQQRT